MNSSPDTTDARIDSPDVVWEQLAECLEEYQAAWDEDGPPSELGSFAPRGPAQVRRLALTELVKLDLEYRAENGLTSRRLEQYLEQLPELADGGVPADLLYEEYHVRRCHGETVHPAEYERRFPEQWGALRQLLRVEGPAATTALLSSVPPTDLRPGDQLDDFHLLAQLGKGAFATVFLARQESLQRMVALKISADRGSEPQTLAQLDHPNIVRVYDQRVMSERGLRLLYMKCVPGGTLEEAIELARSEPRADLSGRTLLAAVDQALDRRSEAPPAESKYRERLESASWEETVCRVGYQLAQALQYAHDHGVLHRDLKPANILLTAEGVPQLVDFNISFCSKLDGATPAAYFGGSLAYMSPEQLEACHPAHVRSPESLTGASDVYSLGVVLWELLSGSRPFEDEKLAGNWSATLERMVARRQQGPDTTALEAACRALPELLSVLRRCLADEPSKRYADAGELAADLRLSLRPEARRLIRPDPAGWISKTRSHAMPVLVLTALALNGPTAYFNFKYNYDLIIDNHPAAVDVFYRVLLVINSVAFPIGVVLILSFLRPITRHLRSTDGSPRGDADVLAQLRRRTLRIGHFVALLAIAEWTLAGVAYPVLMYLGGVRLTLMDNVHFFSSLLLCGLVAAAYPFFVATALAVRAIYPALVDPFGFRTSDVVDLERLERWSWVYLALGLLVPMLAVALMVALGGQQHRLALAVVSGSSLAGFVILVVLARYLQWTIGTLRQISGVANKRYA